MSMWTRVVVGTTALAFSAALAGAQAEPAAGAKSEPATQTKSASPAAPAPEAAAHEPGHEDTRPVRTFYLSNATQQNDANEVLIALRNILSPTDKIYLDANQNAIVIHASASDLSLAERLIRELDRPKKAYRLTYTITELEQGKPLGTQHVSMILVSSQRTTMKLGSKVPVITGSYNPNSAPSGVQTQFQYLDVGLNIDATLQEAGDGVRLQSKVEQSSVADEKLTGEVREPVIRQAVLEGTSLAGLNKPLRIGSLDVPGSTRHLDIEVEIENVK